MRTITYSIQHWTDEDTGGNGECYDVVATETRHIITHDESETYSIGSFATAAEAEALLAAVMPA